MSAYIVSDFQINVIVSWAAGRNGSDAVNYFWEGRFRDIRENPARIASVLYAENVRSVNARYQDVNDAAGFRFKPVPLGYLNVQPVQILKAIAGLEYQSCEASGWEDSEAFAILGGIRRAAIRALPGYEEAPWSLDEPSQLIAA